MAQQVDPVFRNDLLRRLPVSDLALLVPHLVPVTLEKRMPLVSAEKSIERAWFLESGIASVIATTADGLQTEVGLVGREGMVDVSVALGAIVAPLEVFIQAPGVGYAMPVGAFKAALTQSEALHSALLGFAQVMMVQFAHTALAAATLSLKARLARWLLMCDDRTDGNEFTMTHEFLSLMLSVRRPGVTGALQTLQAAGAITVRRGRIGVVDRRTLKSFAGETYGPPEALYKRALPLPA